MRKLWRHVVGVDDARFDPGRVGDVRLIGAVFAGERLDGVLTTRVRRDGANSTQRVATMVSQSRFAPQLQVIMLQGIAFAGFNVVDIRALSERTGLPVLVVARKPPDLHAIRCALLTHVPGGARKWRLIERAGAMEPLAGVWVQRAGLTSEAAARLLREHVRHGRLPEPVRTAHLIASGIGDHAGPSSPRQRA
jgi:uncharacterized protein